MLAQGSSTQACSCSPFSWTLLQHLQFLGHLLSCDREHYFIKVGGSKNYTGPGSFSWSGLLFMSSSSSSLSPSLHPSSLPSCLLCRLQILTSDMKTSGSWRLFNQCPQLCIRSNPCKIIYICAHTHYISPFHGPRRVPKIGFLWLCVFVKAIKLSHFKCSQHLIFLVIICFLFLNR